jgi:hypothetical protein
MRSLHLAALVAAPLLSLSAHAADRITQDRSVTGFKKIRIDGALDMDVREGAFHVQLAAPQDELAHVVTRVEGDTLVIETRDEDRFRFHKGDIHATITLPHLSGLAVNGAGDVRLDGLHTDALALEIRGAGDIDFAGQAKKLSVNLMGAGNVHLAKGRTESLAVVLSGAGHVKAKDLVTHDAKVDLRGTGAVDFTADGGELSLEMHGIGHIRWYGTASNVTSDEDGIGSIQHG